jgi:formylglycine-generating enzyme required for sulfatase activity
MAEIFISYKSERRKAARHLEQILIRYGYTVWFDHALVRGHDYETQIQRQIGEAKAVIVLWCSLSVDSQPVRSEASYAKRENKQIPVKIEPCVLPLFSTLDQHIDLTKASCAPQDAAFYPLLDDIERLVGRAPKPDYKLLRDYDAAWRAMGAFSFARFPLETAAPDEPALNLGNPPPPPSPAVMSAERDWKLIENSTDPRDFRAFIEVYKSGLLVRKAQHRLEDLAEDAFAKAGRDKAALERFLKAHFDSSRVAAASALLAEASRAETERERQGQEARHKAEGRIRIAAALVRPAGLEWFLPGAGKTEGFKDAEFAPEMVVAPAGSFMMGSPPGTLGFGGEPERSDDEGPQRKVAIATPFAIGRYAVTFAEWDAAQQDRDWQAITGRQARLPGDEGWGRADRPAIDVDWDDAKAYAAWLSQKTGKDYRLPSEAEWEYACRAGSVTPFWWGASITPEQANYDGSVEPYKGGGKKGEYRRKTLPVKSFEPNPWGLYQVHGNVWEWCEDLWHDNYNGAPTDGSAWTTGDSPYRVLRGGSWVDNPRALRSACRNLGNPRSRLRFRGFRVARTLPR